MRQSENKQQGERPLGECAAYAGTPGAAYVDGYLAGGELPDRHWIAEQVNDGRLIACPRCHFLRLPRYPFEWDHTLGKGDATEADCDVCAYVDSAAEFYGRPSDFRATLEAAAEGLTRERASRAQTLWELWVGGSRGADALVWAAMAGGLAALRDPAPAGGEGTEG